MFSTNPPERLWGILAAGPYGLAALAALLAGRPGRRIAVAVSLAGAVIVPLAWMAWTGRAQPEVGVVIHSAGLFLHDGTPYQAAHAVATAHNPYVYNPYLPALAVFGVPHALFGGGLLTDPRLWFGVVFVLGFAGTLALSGVAAALAVDGGAHRLAHHRVPAHHGRRRPARAGPDLCRPGAAAGPPRPGGPRSGLVFAWCPGRCCGSSWPAWSWAWPRP